MKKLLLALLLMLPMVASAQYSEDGPGFIEWRKQRKELKEHRKKEKIKIQKENPSVIVQNHIDNAGYNLIQSAKLQYCAVGTAVLGGGLIGIASTIDIYKEEKGIIVKDKDKNANRITLYAFGGISLLSSFICEIVSIKKKMDAGREIRMYSSGNSVGVSYNF